MVDATQTNCPRCGIRLTKITKELGKPALYEPCGHTDLFTELKVQPRAFADPWSEVVRLTNEVRKLEQERDALRERVLQIPEIDRSARTYGYEIGRGRPFAADIMTSDDNPFLDPNWRDRVGVE